MYPKILVPLDGSERAMQVLPHVRLLGKAYNASIELLRVVEPIPPDVQAMLNGMPPEEVAATRMDNARADLEGTALPLKREGLQVSTTVLSGDSSYEIVSKGEQEQDTLVALSTHGRSGLANWTLSGVTDRVLHNISNPLLIIRPSGKSSSAEAKINKMIVPLDGSLLAEQVLPYAMSFAKTLELTVELVRVAPSEDDYSEPASSRPGSRANSYDRAMEYLRSIKDSLTKNGVYSVKLQILDGHPAIAIVNYVKQTQNNLIALTTNGHSGLGYWETGSVAERVSNCGDPVLIIRARS